MLSTMTASAPAPSATPWYRQRWPWLLMSGPAIVIVAGFATLWLAIASDDGLVADDYYKRGLAINRTLERVERAAALQLSAVVDIDDDGRARVTLDTPVPEPAATPTAIRLVVAHPTRAGADHRADLVRGPGGVYVGAIGALTQGRWLVTVETDQWRLPAVETTGGVRALRLAAGR
jgi:hypothetical protein